jgi:hypothetical protein
VREPFDAMPGARTAGLVNGRGRLFSSGERAHKNGLYQLSFLSHQFIFKQ